VKLTVFSCGTLVSQKHLFTMGRGVGTPFTVPVPFFLIEHGRHKILYDTGNAAAVAVDKIAHWGAGVCAAYDPVMAPGDFVVEQLARMGVSADEITHVVLSHLHLDHAGGVGAFPNATYVVQRAEMHYAYVPDFYQKGAYIRADFDKPDLRWLLLDGDRDGRYDLLGDGSVTIIPTPGHTPGHQSLLVRLPESGPWLLTGDSAYTEEIINDDVLPGLVWSPSEAIRSVRVMRTLRDQGVRIITGHDPEAFRALSLAPRAYA